jgi:hypothetical protein
MQRSTKSGSSNSSSRSSSRSQRRRREEYAISSIRNTWRVFLSKIIEAHRAAKHAAPTVHPSNSQGNVNNKDLEIRAKEISKSKDDLRSQLTKVEASLRGNAKEMEALHLFYRSTGSVGMRSKRRRMKNDSKM